LRISCLSESGRKQLAAAIFPPCTIIAPSCNGPSNSNIATIRLDDISALILVPVSIIFFTLIFLGKTTIIPRLRCERSSAAVTTASSLPM
jgi:hypothetical protein